MLDPVIIDNVFTPEQIARLHQLKKEPARNAEYDPYCRRFMIHTDELERDYSSKLEPIAREIFGDPSIRTSYSAYIKYAWANSRLPRHLDMDAGEYTIDYCLSQKTEPWGIFIDGKEYFLKPNQAIAFVGSKLEHYRNEMTDPENNEVEMLLFHFEPGNSWLFNRCDDFVLDSEKSSGIGIVGLPEFFGQIN
jgi:hypothetical protein